MKYVEIKYIRKEFSSSLCLFVSDSASGLPLDAYLVRDAFDREFMAFVN